MGITHNLLILVGLLSSLSVVASALPIPHNAVSLLHLAGDEVPQIRPWAIYHGQPMHS